jgi:hypothetical protein
MLDYYATFECPRCMSTGCFKVKTLPPGPLICPVCSEGEIKLDVSLWSAIRDKSKVLFDWNKLLTVYHAS